MKAAGSVERQTLRALRFRDLMPYRVAEVLVVSSPYDAFILEQDGQLTEQVFLAYTVLRLPSAPRFTHAASGEAALDMLRERHFDLILTMTSLADTDVNAFGRQVKALKPGRPVVVLSLDRKELHDLRAKIDPEAIDGAFLWSGDPKILLAIIMYVEDRKNIDADILRANVRVIVVAEDSPYYYSSFLTLLYGEVVAQARSLYTEGVNEILRQMYMKSRPKILLATSFEEGRVLLERYRSNLLALITDVELPPDAGSEETTRLGLDLVRLVRGNDRDLPVLVQSSELRHQQTAESLNANFIHKGSAGLLAGIRSFVTESLGFGDFVFKMPDGEECGRAHDVADFIAKLAEVPEASIEFHARHNHFSIWLVARSEFELAGRIRPRRIWEFPDIAAVRADLVETLAQVHHEIHRGVVSDFKPDRFDRQLFSRLGGGALGGKGRGLAFLNMKLADIEAEFGELPVRLPKTIVITVEHFDIFLDDNDLRQKAYVSEDDAELTRIFSEASLRPELRDHLRSIVEHLEVPLAVRSSSLLEDSRHQPLAGIYATVMVANNAPTVEARLRDLEASLKLIYASVFWRDARAYLRATGHRVEEEKMAVIVQPLIGQTQGRRFYPTAAGLAQSYNFYPIGPQTPEDGIVHIALGLGRQVVDGGRALRFCPNYPKVMPQFADAATFLDHSQRQFYALDLDSGCCFVYADFESSVKPYDLREAEKDGTLRLVGSVFSHDDRQIRDDLSLRGPRLVTFNSILKYGALPLAPTLSRLLQQGSEGFGGPVEIEFAVDMKGGFSKRGDPEEGPVLYVLQIRPQASYDKYSQESFGSCAAADRLCESGRSLGHGIDRTVRDLIYVLPERWEARDNPVIAAEIGRFNAELLDEDRPYALVGPGRWGSSDPSLGIPVRWSQISSARVMVEASPADYHVEPSHGTHFFQNVTSLGIAYLSLEPGATSLAAENEEGLDVAWLQQQPTFRESDHLRWLRFEEPLIVILDGRRGRGVLAKPGAGIVSP